MTDELQESRSPRLARTLRRRHLTMIALGGTIGTSLFIGSGAVIQRVGPGAVLSYLLGGLLVLVIMRMLGEMAAARPTLGSFSEYAREALGNWAGFLVGWLYWFFWLGVVAFEAVAGAKLVQVWIPDVPQWTLSLVLMVVLTATNLYSARSYGELESALAAIKIIAIIVFMALGALFVLGLWPDRGLSLAPLTENGGFLPHGGLAILAGVVVVIFSYVGPEMVTIAAAESSEPERAVAKATNAVVWRILLFYVGSIFLIVCVLPWREVPTDTSPFAAVLDHLGIPAAATIMDAIILTVVLSAMNSGLYIASRMLFALTAAGDAPRGLNKLNRKGVPYRAILLCTSAGYVAAITSFFAPDTLFYFIINASGAVGLFVYLIIALSEIRLRARVQREQEGQLRVRMWLYPYLSWAAVIAVLAVIISMATIEELRSQLWFTLISAGLFLLLYLLRRRHAPRDTTDAAQN
jgi:GABA permease